MCSVVETRSGSHIPQQRQLNNEANVVLALQALQNDL
jgi:hypothetical protein